MTNYSNTNLILSSALMQKTAIQSIKKFLQMYKKPFQIISYKLPWTQISQKNNANASHYFHDNMTIPLFMY